MLETRAQRGGPGGGGEGGGGRGRGWARGGGVGRRGRGWERGAGEEEGRQCDNLSPDYRQHVSTATVMYVH